MKAYSLIELLIVVSIIGMMAVFGIPSYQRYGKVSQFRDKTEEIKNLVERTYYLAKNPEGNDVTEYTLKIKTSNLTLYKSGSTAPISVISSAPGESFTMLWDIECRTSIPVTCTSSKITFTDTAIKKRAVINVSFSPTPAITVEETDLP
ncbi:MAG TPA: prepilin-type N-terminal cleavage/methylation domain-containing protein [bacterium]|nr:prepilin-type N-terminal cleavage/methylation domain-containing protein [bacterium]